uniref:anhydro-N-acetylmuramic acid kinase n=1 Tax=Yoonia sp. TaxID=2212373 RepID=UPI0025D1AE09
MLQANRVMALGTMSGTSLDGVDAAVIDTDGVRVFGFGTTDYRAYSADEQAVLAAHLGRWPEDGVADAVQIVEDAHLAVMKGFEGVVIAGFHGQTLAHDPAGHRT